MTIKPLLALLVAAHLSLGVTSSQASDLENGAKLYQQCAICHNNSAGAGAKVGPNLWGVLNRSVASSADYQGRYSNALQGVGGKWSAEQLDAFLTNPQAFAPGTIMGFAGLSSASDRVDLIHYLNTQGDSPSEINLIANSANDAPAGPANIGKLFRAPGAEKAFTYCSACHSERIVTQQGLSRADWEELLEWMVDEQGMDELPDEDYNTVINYLSEHYSVDRPNFPN